MTRQLLPGLLQGAVRRCLLHIPRHYRSGSNAAEATLQRMLLGRQNDPFQFIASDVDKFTQLLQRLIQVGAADPDPLAGNHIGSVVQILARCGGLRIAHPGQAVIDHRHSHQHQSVEHDRFKQLVAQRRQRRIRQHYADRHPATRWVQAAQHTHHHQRQAQCQRRHPQRRAEPVMQHQPDQRGTGIAANKRPRLCQRPGMHGKQQHCRSRQRPEQVQRYATAKGVTAGDPGQKQTKQCTNACT
ncbi:hypothetical protein D3C84_739620 [compost metagenome]